FRSADLPLPCSVSVRERSGIFPAHIFPALHYSQTGLCGLGSEMCAGLLRLRERCISLAYLLTQQNCLDGHLVVSIVQTLDSYLHMVGLDGQAMLPNLGHDGLS